MLHDVSEVQTVFQSKSKQVSVQLLKDLEQKRIENGNDSETEEKILVTPTEEALEDLLSIIPQESLKMNVNMNTNMTLFDP